MYKLFVLSACKDTTNNPNMQVFMQKNDVCLQNFIFLHKRLLFAGLCERIFEVGLPLAMSVPSKIPSKIHIRICKFL